MIRRFVEIEGNLFEIKPMPDPIWKCRECDAEGAVCTTLHDSYKNFCKQHAKSYHGPITNTIKLHRIE